MAERYKIYEQLGAGGVGAVYRAYDNELKRWVAIKRLMSSHDMGGDEKIIADLRREADALASLRNPNIVTVFDVASDAEGLFIVLELLEGEDLADVVQRGPLHYDDFKELASQTMEGLLAAHQRHILHRDIKPENIKVERLPGGRMQSKIIDFGLARAGLRARKQTEDQSGTVMGSIHYMAPEQLTRKPVDERTDLYALGCVFYEALSGRKAFDGESVSSVIDKHINHDLVPLHIVAPHVPAWLGVWVMRLMACKPDDRPISAQQGIEEFRAWEKMSSAPQVMPWMPMSYAPMPPQYPQAMYPTGAVPMGSATTSSVPVQPIYYQTGQVPAYQTGQVPPYHQTGQVPPTAYVTPPVEVIPVAQPIIEMAAHTTQIHQVRSAAPGGHTASQRPGPARPPVPSKKTDVATGVKADAKIKLYAMIGGAVLLAVIASFFLFGGKGGGDSSTTAKASAPAPSGGPEAVVFQLPMDRAFPPQDADLVLHLVSTTGASKNAKAADGKPAAANNGEPVFAWHDLSPRGKGNTLRAFESNTKHAPIRQNWTPIGLKGGRVALDFRPREGQPCSLTMVSAGSESGQFPFGSSSVKGPAGLTFALVFQADGAHLPTRVATLTSDKGAKVSLVVNKDKHLVAEFDNGAGGACSITSKDVDGTKPALAILTWDADTGATGLRDRDGSGRTFKAEGDKLPKPASPLSRLQMGRVKDGQGTAVSSADQFAGWIAECETYASVLRQDQLQLMENTQLRDFYFGNTISPLAQRLKTKLSQIEPRSGWKFSASHNGGELKNVADGNPSSRWTTKTPQKPGQWVRLELPSEQSIAGLALDTETSRDDYPRQYLIEISADGNAWTRVVESKGSGPITEIIFPTPQTARHLRITQQGSDAVKHWGFAEIVLFKK